MAEFDTPGYHGDLQGAEGFPPGADRLRKRLETGDGLVLVCPECNFSMPGNLKNTIDWVPRFRPQPFQQKHALLMSDHPRWAGATEASGH